MPEALASLPPPAAAADPETAVRDAFRAALAGFRRDDGPVLVMGHNDADGLSATAIFLRALRKAGWTAAPRILGRGENPWSAEMAAELAGGPRLGGIIATDLGTRPGAIKPGTPTVIVDHHVPAGTPEDADHGHHRPRLRPDPHLQPARLLVRGPRSPSRSRCSGSPPSG